MAALIAFYYFILSLSSFHPHPLLSPYNPNVSTLTATGERQRSGFDLGDSQRGLAVIKGAGELHRWPWGRLLMNDMKQPWEISGVGGWQAVGGGGSDGGGGGRQATAAPRTALTCDALSRHLPRGFTLKHTLGGMYADVQAGFVHTGMQTTTKKLTAYKHLPSKDALAKALVYWRIDQIFYCIIHVLSKPPSHLRATFLRLPLTLTLDRAVIQTWQSDDSA